MPRSQPAPLTTPEIERRLTALDGWTHSRGAIRRTLRFADFKEALAFVNRVGRLAEKAGHHPDIDIRYSRVRLALSTHDASGITAKDFALAGVIDSAIGRRKLA